VSGVFNVAQITQGKSLADWKPEGGQNADQLTHARGDAGARVPFTRSTNKEHTSMGTRQDIRNAIEKKGSLTYTEIKAMFPDLNVAAPLCQMAGEGTLKRSGKGKEAIYTPGRAPGSVRKTGAGKNAKKTGAKPAAFKFKRSVQAAKPRNGYGARALGSAIAEAVEELRARRDQIDSAIAALEQLPA
jgi:hypothetical protein